MTQAITPAAFSDANAVALANEGNQIRLMCEAVKNTPITNQQELDAVGELVRQINARGNAIDAWRKSQNKPHKAQIDKLNAYCKPVLDACEALEQAGKARLSRHYQETAAAQQTAQLQAAAALQAGNAQAATQALAAIPAPAATAGISPREVLKFEVVNPAMVPSRFWVIDESAIRKFVQETKGESPIPGVKIWKDLSIAAATP
jgi:hypothetical protein